MVTMLLGGLWHGASWMFVVWGGLHGLYLGVEKFVRGRRWAAWPGWGHPVARTALALLTVLLVCVTWVFFRSRSMGGALDMLAAMIAARGMDMAHGKFLFLVALALFMALFAAHRYLGHRDFRSEWMRINPAIQSIALAFMLFMIAVSFTGEDRAFIYFQF